MTAILIILAACVFVAGFYGGWLTVSRGWLKGVDSMTWIKAPSP